MKVELQNSNYIHPKSHSADMIDETETRKFISKKEKEEYSDKYSKSETNTLLSNKVDKELDKGLSTNNFDDNYKNKLDNIENEANKYVHPDRHSADMIDETETKKFVTTSEKNTWSDKYTKNEVDNKFSTFESNIDWKESVNTFSDITTTYSNPQDGWTVNVKDTDYTYRYNGSEWVAISANAIPKATQEVDGLLTKEDYSKIIDSNDKKHTHTNKNIIDTITQQQLETWNSVSNKVDKVTGKSLISDTEISKISKINVDVNNNITNNAKSATKLETTRKINGVDFDGTADISINGKNFVSWSTVTKNNIWNRICHIQCGQIYTGSSFILNITLYSSGRVINCSIYVTISAFNINTMLLPSNSYNETGINAYVRFMANNNEGMTNQYIEIKPSFLPGVEIGQINFSLMATSSTFNIETYKTYTKGSIPETFFSEEVNCDKSSFDKQIQSNAIGQGASLIGISDIDNNFTSINVEGALSELINNLVPIIPLAKSTFIGNTDWNTAPKGIYTINNMTGANAPLPNGYAYGIFRNTIIPTWDKLSIFQEYEPFPSPAYPNPMTYKRVCFDSQWSGWNTYPSSKAQPTGTKGDKGDKGETGQQGIQGIQGIRGATGAKGDKGDKGEPGSGGGSGQSVYNLVIRTQSEFDAMSSLDGVKSICILSGKYVSKKTFSIPSDVISITGIGNVELEFSNLPVRGVNYCFEHMGYNPNSFISNINIKVNTNYEGTYGCFKGFENVINCSASFNCIINDMIPGGYGNPTLGIGFYMCSNLINCNANCRIEGVLNGAVDGDIISYLSCSNIINCKANIMASIEAGGRQSIVNYKQCNCLVNCSGEPDVYDDDGYVFYDCSFLNNCHPTYSMGILLGGVNTHVDTLTVAEN